MVAKPNNAPTPGAWVVTNNRKDKSQPSDKGRKSVKNGKIYLNDGESFEIELYNPLSDCILCDIKLNGQSISKTGLVLKPAQRFYLDCFIDDNKKFVFSTYDVENSIESNNAISKNGLLEVYFYKEDVVQINNWKKRFDPIIIREYYPIYYTTYQPVWITTPGIYYGTTNNSYTTDQLSNTNCNFTSNSSIGTTTNTSNIYGGVFDDNAGTINLNSAISNNIETGRIEKGTASSQKFDEIDMQFQSMYLACTILQILPNSVKPIEVEDIVNKKFCVECGFKLKEKFKFCPSCGEKI